MGVALKDSNAVNQDESDQLEYYNFIPNEDDMYMYMQTGPMAVTNDSTELLYADTAEDRDKHQSGLVGDDNNRDYANINREKHLNLRLPGSEYGEVVESVGTTKPAGIAGMGNGSTDMGQKDDNSGEDEELYTTMA